MTPRRPEWDWDRLVVLALWVWAWLATIAWIAIVVTS